MPSSYIALGLYFYFYACLCVTLDPTIEPTVGPTAYPTIYPTEYPTNSTMHPSMIPIVPPTDSRTLYFVCKYKDDKEIMMHYLSLSSYAKTMVDSIIRSLQSVSFQPIYYDENNHPLAPWKKGGILTFIICNVFDTVLLSSNIECPSYYDVNGREMSRKKDGIYIAIGVLDIAADHGLSEYQQWLTDLITTQYFRYKFNENMNERLTNITSVRRRILLDYNSFEMIKVEIIDPLNNTLMSVNDIDIYKINKRDKHFDIIYVYITIALSVIIVILLFIVSFIKFKQTKLKKKITENVGYHTKHNYHHPQIEMKELKHEETSNSVKIKQIKTDMDDPKDMENAPITAVDQQLE